MDGHHSKRTRHNKSSKSSRKSRPISLQPIISGEISSPFHRSLDVLTGRSSSNTDSNRLIDIIGDITSENDEMRVTTPAQLSARSSSSRLVEPDSPQMNENRDSLFTLPLSNETYAKKPGRAKRFSAKEKRGEKKSFSPIRISSFDDRPDSSNRRKSIGDQRQYQLTECMEYYRRCLESAQNSYPMGNHDDSIKTERRQQYTTALW